MQNKLTLEMEKAKRALLAFQRRSWEQGVAAQAFLELGDTDMVILLAKEAVLHQYQDGRLALFSDDQAVTDPAANGEAVLFAARATGDPLLKQAADKMLAYLLDTAPKTLDGILYHITNKPQLWIDSMYMAPPFLAVADHPHEAVKQINGLKQRLWNPDKKLYSHIWDEGKNAFERQIAWGVGNGWAAAGIARVIAALPTEMKIEKQALIDHIHDILDGCLAHQRSDGFFHNVVDDPTTFVETNLAQMLAYTIYHGVQEGWLEDRYIPFADQMRAAVHTKIDDYGLVQGVCGSPTFDHPGVAAEGQAFFLLMESRASSHGREFNRGITPS